MIEFRVEQSKRKENRSKFFVQNQIEEKENSREINRSLKMSTDDENLHWFEENLLSNDLATKLNLLNDFFLPKEKKKSETLNFNGKINRQNRNELCCR